MLGNDVRKKILKLFKTWGFIKLLLKMEMLGKFIFYCVIFIKMEDLKMDNKELKESYIDEKTNIEYVRKREFVEKI